MLSTFNHVKIYHVQLSVIKYIHIAVQPPPSSTSGTFSSSPAEIPCPLNTNAPLPLPTKDNQHSTLCLYEFGYSRNLISAESSVTGLFHSVCLQDSSML